jgi:hypothetical protein
VCVLFLFLYSSSLCNWSLGCYVSTSVTKNWIELKWTELFVVVAAVAKRRKPQFLTHAISLPRMARGKITCSWHTEMFLLICILLSRVRGSVTNKNGFWIGWLNLLTPSFTITFNSSQSMPAYDSLHSLLDYECLLWWLTWLWFTNRSLLRMTNEGSHMTSYSRIQTEDWLEWRLHSDWILFRLNHDWITCAPFITPERTE